MAEFNRRIFLAINHWPDGLAPLMRFLSTATDNLWFKILLLALVVAMIWRGKRSRTTAVQVLIAFPIANFITDQFKHFMPMNRPFVDISPAEMILRIGNFPMAGDHPSFGTASAHSANMAAVAFVFCYHLKGWGVPWVIIAVAVGLSRIYNGVHYPYQVLLGWTTGLVVAAIVTKTWERIQTRRQNVNQVDGAHASQSA